ncbi:ovochymase [Ketogulonicigenium robustum]|uniref:Probable periplasmic serine endoprotease DegP-like n=1 Tax=Ketogulonicigenium robustum TaxID=92947 RepID=A0A1W6NY70_9RHOB|nr:Do family serine endopeptidase [Ketogulonicigenium robustum]ARO13967.1 ovochymase [Ketogulonicigenium robustum]
MTQKSDVGVLSLVRPRKLVAALMLGSAIAIAVMPQVLPAQEVVTPVQALTPEQSPIQMRPMSFADLAEQVSPAVVNITTSMLVASPSNNPAEGTPFEDFFRQFGPRQGQEAPTQRANALGSGFVISADGYIVTNNHVIADADQIQIEFFSGDSLPATVVGTDPNTDIALLKVDATDLPYVEFGDSNGDGSRVGDWVMAMGNPLGQGFSVSAGIISARNRELSGTYDDYIQTDAAINRGNSGGPLFNMEGQVIGVNTAILSPNGGSIGIGFAMSSSVVKGVTDQLREFGETRRGWLGARVQAVTQEMVGAMPGLDKAAGALISDVPEGPARDAGLKAGDVVLTFDGKDVTDSRGFVQMIGAAGAGQNVTLGVLRDGEVFDLPITLGRREEAEGQVAAGANQTAPSSAHYEGLGLKLQEVTPSLAERFNLQAESGLVITEVDPESEAAARGLAAGDVITDVSNTPVKTSDDVEQIVKAARDAGRTSVMLLVRRGGDPRFVALPID